MKYPVLIVGIVLFGIFLSQDSTKKWWNKISRRYVPSTCDAVMDRVAPKAPKNWEMECPGTQFLVINIDFAKTAKSHAEQRVLMYKEIANNLTRLAHYSNIETLEFLKHIKLIMRHKNLQILAQTDGQAVAKYKVLKRKEEILKHLQLTVKVNEKIP